MAGDEGGLKLRSRDGTVAMSPPDKVADVRFLPGGRRAVLVVFEGPMLIRDLETGTDVELQRTGSSRRYQASADGSHIVVFGQGEPLEVLDTTTGKRLFQAKASTEAAALAPDGSWVAWMEHDEPSNERPPTLTVHLRRIGRRFPKVAPIRVEGWPKQMVVSPRGDELLVVTESSITRWWPSRRKHQAIPGIGHVVANRIRYSPDGRQLFFEHFNRVELRNNDDGLAVLATIYPQLDGGWSVMSAKGAVDGSGTAPHNVMTVVEGPKDMLVHDGTLGWDRFAVSGLYARARAGEVVEPPLPSAPRPSRR